MQLYTVVEKHKSKQGLKFKRVGKVSQGILTNIKAVVNEMAATTTKQGVWRTTCSKYIHHTTHYGRTVENKMLDYASDAQHLRQ